jgi:hypothetical protein
LPAVLLVVEMDNLRHKKAPHAARNLDRFRKKNGASLKARVKKAFPQLPKGGASKDELVHSGRAKRLAIAPRYDRSVSPAVQADTCHENQSL